MAINFTDSPSNGATQTISGRTYTYNSAKNKWDTSATEVAGPTATTYATVNDLPGTATTGAQAFVSATNRLYIWNGSGWYNIALINNTPTWGTQPASSYTLATDGTATVVSIVASDPEGIPITYSITSDTSGSVATVVQGTGLNTNSWTITPSTSNADAGTFSLTFRASDGINIASAISSFTLQFQVQNSNYTTALITSVGANNAVNNSFDDKSASNHTITANGDAKQTTFSPYRHGGYSTYFDGSGDYLSIADDAGFTVGSGDFTAECWVYPTASPNQPVIFGQWSNPYSWAIQLSNDGNRNARMIFHDGGFKDTTTSTPVALNAWTHLALVKNGSTATIYVNGVSAGTNTIGTLTDSSNAVTVGGLVGGGQPFNGYITDTRLVIGTAVYTSNFTPPTERLTAITNTSLLACHLPYIADGSTNNHAITINGNTSTQPFAPYDEQEYSASSHGGSMYFDGSGDYVTAPSDTSFDFGTGDFTIEMWINIPDVTSAWQAFISRAYSNNGGWRLYKNTGDNNLRFYYTDGGSTSFLSATSTGITNNTWHHIAVVRNSSTTTIYVDGVSKTSGTITTSLNPGSYAVEVGSGVVASSYPVTGNMADVRIVKGTAVYTTNFTPPAAPLTAITNTSLLLSGTDAGIIDKSQSNKLLTLTGNTKSSTTQTKYLSSSMYFDGSGDNIYTGVLTTAGDFTVEMWIRFDGQIPNPANQSPTFFVWGTTTFMLYATSTTGVLNMIGNGSGLISSSTAMTADTWHHVAFARQGSTGRLFLNGTLEGSTTSFSTNLNARAVIGSEESLGYPFKGYMSDVRITKGLARYTSNFTAPAAALQG